MEHHNRDATLTAHRAAWVRMAWVPVLLGWVLGCGAQLLQSGLWSAGHYAVAAAAGGVGLLLAGWRARPGGWWMAAVAAAVLGWGQVGWRAADMAGRLWPAALDGSVWQARWQVVDLPRQHPHGHAVRVQVLALQAVGSTPAAPPPLPIDVWLHQRDDRTQTPAPWPGQIWQGQLRLRQVQGSANPRGFDAAAWGWRQGLAAQATTVGAPAWVRDEPWAYPVARARAAVRESMRQRLAQRFDAATVGLLVALVTGDQASIPAPGWDVIRATGVAHLVAISGLHVTMFAAAAVLALGRLWRAWGRRRPTLLLRWPAPTVAASAGLALATAYAVFAGWGIPAQRTLLMLAIVLGLRLGGRSWPWPVTWLTALAAVLLIDPWAWLQAGFWLSFVAVAVLFGQGWDVLLGAGWGERWRAAALQLWRSQWVVTLALAPLLLAWFGQVSLVGLLANLLAVPWVTWGITPLALLGVAVPVVLDAAAWLAQALWWALERMAAWPGAVWHRPVVPWPLAALATLGAYVLVQRWPWLWRAWGALLLWPALAWRVPTPAPGTFEVLLPDVGQGSAAIVRTARHTLVFDTGPPLGQRSAAERVLLPQLRALGARVDAVVISHDDSDHASGASRLFQAWPRAQRWHSSPAALGDPTEVLPCRAGGAWTWDGVPFTFIHPPPDGVPAGDNERSCVLVVGQGEAAAVLPGDIPATVEQAIVAAYPRLRAGLLVAAHHGSRTSTSDVWLDTLRPRVVAIQAGAGNRYGHPHPQVLQRVQARGIDVVSTQRCGAITWRSAAPRQWDCARDGRAFYWQAGATALTAAVPAASATRE
ncbi:DNA internalization-related competence protein ComEC/Rec2 [Tepidimonas aquatica]|uniref:ComE operon protein 3 n=1 Tax=Tepidimonas aquatica TaxID=247482 RepID=A0A554WVM2_9BURK|nr:DNA internalization-related competence protein ComEC/Rec2 [Tepidimonas aquatica]TSE27626.1 ComE operon protein 3 [Tepidimonas aquatica]